MLLWIALLALARAGLPARGALGIGILACAIEFLTWLDRPAYLKTLLWPIVLAWLVGSLLWGPRNRWTSLAKVAVLTVVLGQSLVHWWSPHYAAPIVPLILAWSAETLRRLCRLGRSPIEPWRIGWTLAVLLALHASTLTALSGWRNDPNLTLDPPGSLSRRGVVAQLEARGGQHLVFVRYASSFSAHFEWVFNGADLSTAPVVFAHDLGPKENARLVAGLPGRSIWIARLSKIVGARGPRQSRRPVIEGVLEPWPGPPEG